MSYHYPMVPPQHQVGHPHPAHVTTHIGQVENQADPTPQNLSIRMDPPAVHAQDNPHDGTGTGAESQINDQSRTTEEVQPQEDTGVPVETDVKPIPNAEMPANDIKDTVNPWDLGKTIEDFHFYCCPQCAFKCHSGPLFQEHALDNHTTHAAMFFANHPPIQEDKIKSEPFAAEDFLEEEMVYSDPEEMEDPSYFPLEDASETKSTIRKSSKSVTEPKKRGRKRKSPDETVIQPIKARFVFRDDNENPFGCSHCPDISFAKVHQLTVHLYEDHSVGSAGKHPCPLCHFTCPTQDLLKEHITEKHEQISTDETLKEEEEDIKDGEQVDEETGMKFMLPDHTPVHSCKFCSKDVKGLTNLFNHLTKFHKFGSVRNWACPKCSFNCDKKKLMREHIDKVHEPYRAMCPVCAKEVKPKALQVHLQRHEDKAQNKVFKCDMDDNCDFESSTQMGLYTHKRNVHNPNLKKLQCDECGRVYKYRSDLDRHRLAAHKPKQFICDLCGNKFATPESLKVHEKNHIWTNTDKTYQCDMCVETFPCLRDYINHYQQIHKKPFPDNVDRTNLKLYYCDECPNVYMQRVSFKAHKKYKHQGAKRCYDTVSAPCPHCGKNIRKGVKMTEHIKSKHEMDTPFKCPQCPKGFGTAYGLRQHVNQSHGKTKCTVCQRELTSKFSLKHHMAKDHGIVPENCVQCDMCSKVFDTDNAKIKHMMAHHAQ